MNKTSEERAAPLDLAFLQQLQNRETRDESGLMFVEQERFVITALTTRVDTVAVVLSKRRRKNPVLEKLIARHRSFGRAVIELADDDHRALTRAEDPHGVAAVVRQPWSELPSVKSARNTLWLAFEQIRSPGNLGTALRTGAAAGATGAIFLGDKIDPFDPAAIRSTMGAIFLQRLIRTTPDELAAWKRATRTLVVGSSARADRDFRQIPYRRPLVLMLGCERSGLSEDQRLLSDRLVRIPMSGRVDSLNVSIAASLLLYEVERSDQKT